jgi:hypothetical protein
MCIFPKIQQHANQTARKFNQDIRNKKIEIAKLLSMIVKERKTPNQLKILLYIT